jgi:uncharacterized protein DUF5670
MADCALRRAQGGLRLSMAEFRRWIHRPPWQAVCMSHERRRRMVLTIVFVCLILWFLGLMTSYTLGGMLNILLVVAIVFFLVHLIQGRSIGNA